jgi:hypothetical protein
LLRALRAKSSRELWWSAYGLAAAAFCYTHNYAFFTLFAQAVFVLGDLLVRAWRTGWREAGGVAAGALWGVAIAVILYAPWLGVLRRQSSDVHEGYWIPPIHGGEVARVVSAWASGTTVPGNAERWVLAGLAVVALFVTVWSCRRAQWFFLLQALVPWEFALGISLYTGRSILLDRCLVFAHLGLVGYVAVLWAHTPGLVGKGAFAWIVGSIVAAGAFEKLSQTPAAPSAVELAMQRLAEEHRPGDVVVVDGARYVNVALYYARRAGIADVKVVAQGYPFAKGHQVHVASLAAEELYWEDEELLKYERIWAASEFGRSVSVPRQFTQAAEYTFGGKREKFHLALFRRVQ